MNRYRVVNVVICYENEDEVVNYAKELSKQTIKDSLKLEVVVNKEGKGVSYLCEKLEGIDIGFEIVKPGDNIGYLNGLLYGYKACENQSDWYILSNTDIVIPDIAFVEKFLDSSIADDPDTWVVGPSVYAPLGHSYSNPYMKCRPTKKQMLIRNRLMHYSGMYDMLFRMKKWFKSDKVNEDVNKSSHVYAIHGSFMFVRKELLSVLVQRPMWELLYAEEQYIAEVLLQQKKLAYYEATLSVRHMEGTSTGKEKRRMRYDRMVKSNSRILNEFYVC